MAKATVLVVGSSNTDMIVQVDHLPKVGETVLGGEFACAAGGKGGNQAVSAARAGGQVTFIARVGRDMFGDQAVQGFAKEGINIEHVVRDATCPSGVALIFVGKTGENSIAVSSGANGRLSSKDVRRARRIFKQSDVLLAQLEIPLTTVETAIALAVAAGVRVILNPAPARSLAPKVLRSVYLLTPNETEAESLTGVVIKSKSGAAQAAEQLLARGVQNVIVTLGAQGAFVAGENLRQWIPGYKVKTVDATGAGDVFNGTLAVALAEGKPLLEAARFASAAAALSVTRLGAQPSAPTRMEIEQMLAAGQTTQARSKGHTNGWNGQVPSRHAPAKKSRQRSVVARTGVRFSLESAP